MAKDSFRATAGELQKKIESQGQKTCTKLSNNTYITTLFGRASRKKIKKNAFTKNLSTAYSLVRHNWNFKWDWLLWSNVTKKYSFLAANTQDGFGEHRDKKYPMCTMTFTAVFFML